MTFAAAKKRREKEKIKSGRTTPPLPPTSSSPHPTGFSKTATVIFSATRLSEGEKVVLKGTSDGSFWSLKLKVFAFRQKSASSFLLRVSKGRGVLGGSLGGGRGRAASSKTKQTDVQQQLRLAPTNNHSAARRSAAASEGRERRERRRRRRGSALGLTWNRGRVIPSDASGEGEEDRRRGGREGWEKGRKKDERISLIAFRAVFVFRHQ